MADMTVEEVADKIYVIVKDADGKKLLKPLDCVKMMKAQGVDKKVAKAALQLLTTDGRCVYEYAGGSYIKLDKG